MAERKTKISSAPEDSKMLRRELGSWLKQQRETVGLTQAELADRLNLRYYSFVSQVENGIGRIPQDLYAPWADALSIDPATFARTVVRYLEPGLDRMLASTDDGWRPTGDLSKD